MKKTLLLLILCLASMAMTVWSQDLNQVEPENVIDVVGYFYKNDTLTYELTHYKYKIQENDTTVSDSYVQEFMIVVTDSTSEGYKMKYIPLSLNLNDADMGTSLMENAMRQLMQSVVVEFTTDEYGSIKSITNWREIRDHLKKGVKATCDTLYSTIPGLDSIMPRKSLENLMKLGFSTEKDVRDYYEVFETLFGLHGSSFEICDDEEDTEEQGYPQHSTLHIGYTPIEDEDYDHNGDYDILKQSTMTVPVEDVMNLGLGVLMMMGNMGNDSLDVDLDQIVDSVKTEKPNGADFIVKEFYRFFLNGWLKEYYYKEAADIGFYQSIETHYIRCISSYMRI